MLFIGPFTSSAACDITLFWWKCLDPIYSSIVILSGILRFICMWYLILMKLLNSLIKLHERCIDVDAANYHVHIWQHRNSLTQEIFPFSVKCFVCCTINQVWKYPCYVRKEILILIWCMHVWSICRIYKNGGLKSS